MLKNTYNITYSLIFFKKQFSLKYKNIEFFYLNNFLNVKIKNGKKRTIFLTFFNWFNYVFKNYFYNFNKLFFSFKKKNDFLIFKLNYIPIFDFNSLLFNSLNTYKKSFFFFNNKRKTYINHKKTYFNEITFFVEKQNLHKIHLLKFYKILYLKNFKKKINLLINNELINYDEKTSLRVIEVMVLELIWKKNNN